MGPAKHRKSYTHWIVLGVLFVVFSTVVYISTRSQHAREPETDTKRISPPPVPSLQFGMEEKQLLELVEKNPENPEYLARLGDLYFEGGRYEKAIELYKRALNLNPQDADTYNDLGLALYYTGRSDIAIDTLRKGTDVMPSYQRVWLSLGFVLMSNGRNEEAVEALTKARDLDPGTTMGKEAQGMLERLR
jgi:tetratricopeptide (TPR) repeat protein